MKSFETPYRFAKIVRQILLRHLSLILVFSATASAQESTAPATQTLQPLPQEAAESLDQLQASIAAKQEDIERLTDRAEDFQGAAEAIFIKRIDRTTTEIFKLMLDLAEEAALRREQGFDISAYLPEVLADLESMPDGIDDLMARHEERINFPTEDDPPQKFVYDDQKLFNQLQEVDNFYEVLVDFIEIAEEFGLETAPEQRFVADALIDSVANRSIFLELAMDDVSALRSSVSTLPNNTELADWYSAAQTRVQITAAAMQRTVRMMDAVGIESREYRGQLLAVTGEITTDVLDVGIVSNLASEWGASILDLLAKEGPKWLLRLFLMALIIFAAFQIAKVVQKVVIRGLNSGKVNISYLLKEMISASAKNLVILFGLLIALSQMGISLGPLLAGLGIAGFILGFALQDSLSNFASGMLILIYRPFDVGDVVESGGVIGKVNNMTLVNTTFLTLDNQKLVVPNNMIWSSIIKNVTAQRQRRVDLIFGISYGDDIEKAEKILLEILNNHEAVLDDPAATVRVHELADSSVNFAVRPWVKTEDYWEAYWDITKEVKLRFDREGISIPFPQRDVHVYNQHKVDS